MRALKASGKKREGKNEVGTRGKEAREAVALLHSEIRIVVVHHNR